MCHAGKTQIGKILAHAKKETQLLKVAALVSLATPWRKTPMPLSPKPILGRLGIPVFMFQEGPNRAVEEVFSQIASYSHGAYWPLRRGAAKQLGELLRAARALCRRRGESVEGRNDAASVRLLGQLK